MGDRLLAMFMSLNGRVARPSGAFIATERADELKRHCSEYF
jgi:hypothetical protein